MLNKIPVLILLILSLCGCVDFKSEDIHGVTNYLNSKGIEVDIISNTGLDVPQNKYVIRNGELYAQIWLLIKLPKDYTTRAKK